jgi:hypothetical protein
MTTWRDDWYDALSDTTRAFAMFLPLEIVGGALSKVEAKLLRRGFTVS